MFEQELEMEKRESSIVPLLLIVTLIVALVGTTGYYLLQSRKVLSNQEATQIATTLLKTQRPAELRFHTGMVKGSIDDKPHDPHYKMLAKAGMLTLGKDTGQYGTITPITMTPSGTRLLAELQGVTTTKEKDGTKLYVVPLATRQLVQVSRVEMKSPSLAVVDYSWKWEPNKLGNMFDASGSMVKSFNTWDRATLIDKYGANFYHGDPTKVTVTLSKGNNGWQLATD